MQCSSKSSTKAYGTTRDCRSEGLKSLARIFFPLLARKSSGFARKWLFEKLWGCSTRAPHFHTRATRARSGEVHFALCRGAPGLAAGQNASQTRPTIRSGDRHFHARAPSSLRRPAFLRSSSIRSSPFFTLPRHIPTKIWDECPPPPPDRRPWCFSKVPVPLYEFEQEVCRTAKK